jgi:hypothetical protein
MSKPIWCVAAFAFVGTASTALNQANGQTQCEWVQTGGPGQVRSLLGVDEGELPFEDGPVLFAGGRFTQLHGVPTPGIARWDGTTWFPMPGGAGARAMAVYDGALYIGAESLVKKWDGQEWSTVGVLDTWINVMLVFDDDGAGPNPPALYVAGELEGNDTLQVNGIARWDGHSWSAMGGGVTVPGNGNQSPQPGEVEALTIYQGTLLVGGQFTEAGGISAHNVARWDGANWMPMGASPGVDEDETVQDFEVIDGELYASVCYRGLGTNHHWYLAQWNPLPEPSGTWMQVTEPLGWDLDRIEPFRDGYGNGESMYISGYFDIPADGGVAPNIVKWDHTTGAWMYVGEPCCGSRIWAMTLFDNDGDGPSPPDLYVSTGGVSKLNCFLCTSDFDCDDSAPCTYDTCDSAAGCLNSLSPCGLADGCCASDCEPSSDPDCVASAIPGDLDCDGDVDAVDLAQCLGDWGPYGPCPPHEPADLDENCAVDAQDLATLLGNWG